MQHEPSKIRFQGGSTKSTQERPFHMYQTAGDWFSKGENESKKRDYTLLFVVTFECGSAPLHI